MTSDQCQIGTQHVVDSVSRLQAKTSRVVTKTMVGVLCTALASPAAVGGAGVPTNLAAGLTTTDISGAIDTAKTADTSKAAADTARAADTSVRMTVLPFHIGGSLVLFEADVNGQHGVLMLDTGAEITMINTLRVKPTNVGDSSPAPGGRIQGTIAPGVVPAIQVGAFTLRDVPVVFANLESLEKQVGEPVLGILGAPQLEPFEMILDHQARHLVFVRLDSLGHPLTEATGFIPKDTVPLIGGTTPHIYAYSGDVEMNFLIDTGAEQYYLTNDSRSTLGNRIHPSKEPGSNLTVMDHLRVGRSTYDTVSFVPYNEPGNAVLVGGIIGQTFLKAQGQVGFNLRAGNFLLAR